MKKLTRQLPLLIIWLILSVILWGFVFNFLTDTTADKKIVIMIDAQLENEVSLAVLLEGLHSDTVKMVKVHPFTYALMDASAVASADILIIAEGDIEQYQDYIMPVSEEFGCEESGILLTGQIDRWLAEYCRNVNYYLCFGNSGAHITDGEAIKYAKALIELN